LHVGQSRIVAGPRATRRRPDARHRYGRDRIPFTSRPRVPRATNGHLHTSVRVLREVSRGRPVSGDLPLLRGRTIPRGNSCRSRRSNIRQRATDLPRSGLSDGTEGEPSHEPESQARCAG
jgi:hypothetical protein